LTLRGQKGEMRYHWQEDTLYFQNLVVSKPKDNFLIMKNMHNEIMHFGEARMFVEIKKRFFWHDRIVLVKKFVKVCDRCQLAK
jgi:hypothetical protein